MAEDNSSSKAGEYPQIITGVRPHPTDSKTLIRDGSITAPVSEKPQPITRIPGAQSDQQNEGTEAPRHSEP